MFDDDGESAIENALLAAYPGSEPLRFAIPDPRKADLAGCIAVRVSEPIPHWVVVSRGFTELDEKKAEDPAISGWGFELTCRLPARSDEPDFGWIVGWMRDIAGYLAERVTFLDTGHHMPMQEARSEDELSALAFVEDNDLAPSRSRNGGFAFLQMVGLTTGEYEALQQWDALHLVELIRSRDPLLLMDAERATYLRDPAFARAVAEGSERDGSSTAILYGVSLVWFVDDEEIQIHLGVDAVELVKATMKSRLRHGKPMLLFGDRRRTVRPDGSVAVRSQVNLGLRPEEGVSEITEGEDGGKVCVLRLDDDAISELATMLDAAPGTYVLPSLAGVRFIVVSTERIREPRYPS
jgi:suppressor of fused